MFVLSFQDLIGALYLAEGTGYQFKYELGQKELEIVLSQLDLMTKQVGNSLDIYDNDDDENNQSLGNYSNGVLNTDIKINDYIDLRVFEETCFRVTLEKEWHP